MKWLRMFAFSLKKQQYDLQKFGNKSLPDRDIHRFLQD